MAIQVGIGQSVKKNSQEAAFEAAAEAAGKLKGGTPSFFIMFGSSSFDSQELLKGARTFLPVPVFGCSSEGEITNRGWNEKSVVVMALQVPKEEFVMGGVQIDGEPKTSAAHLASELQSASKGTMKACVILPDILEGDGAEIVSGIEGVLGVGFPLVGGSPSDAYKFEKTFQYAGEKSLSGSIVGLGLGGNIKAGVSIRHGWIPVGVPRIATKSVGNILYEIDNVPAIRIYEDYFGKDSQSLVDESLARIAVNYPLGMKTEERHEYLIRNPIRAFQDGSIKLAANIPTGASVNIMLGGRDKAIEAAQLAAQHLFKQLGGKTPDFVLMFSSVARKKLFGDEAHNEIKTVLKEIGGVETPLIGFYTFGEQGNAHAHTPAIRLEESRFYNETIALFGIVHV